MTKGKKKEESSKADEKLTQVHGSEQKTKRGRKKTTECITLKVNGPSLNPNLKGDKILDCFLHFPLKDIVGKDISELNKGSIINVPFSFKNKNYKSLSCTVFNPNVERVEDPGVFLNVVEPEPEEEQDLFDEEDDVNVFQEFEKKSKVKFVNEDDVDDLNESTASLNLNENMLANISHSIEKQNNLLQSFVDRNFEIQSKILETQDKNFSVLKEILKKNEEQDSKKSPINDSVEKKTVQPIQPILLSSSSSEDESDEMYVIFRDTFLALMKKKLPDTALKLDMRTLKAVYTLEMDEIQEALRKLVNFKEDLFRSYWLKVTSHKRYLRRKAKGAAEKGKK